MKTKVNVFERVGECLAVAGCAALVVSFLLGATEIMAAGNAITCMLVSVLAGLAGIGGVVYGAGK